jgi:hypothetical protein
MDVQITALLSGGSAAANAEGSVELLTGGVHGGPVGGAVVGDKEYFALDEDGLHTLQLTPNSEYDIDGTIYRVRLLGRKFHIEVPATGGPYDLGDTSIWTVSTPPALIVPQPVSGGEASLSDDDPAALAASADPGAATEAARGDHVHARPTAAQVGADPAGSASTAQAAATAAAATDATTKANAAQSAAISAASTDATTKANAAQAAAISAAATDATTKANAAETDANAYTDDEVAALMQAGDGIGTRARNDSGIDRRDLITRKATVAGAAVSNTVAETTLLTTPVAFSAGAMSVDSVLRIIAYGQFTNNSGANRDVTLRLKVGTHAAFAFAFTAITTSASARPWRAEFALGFQDFLGIRCDGAATMSLGAPASSGLDFGTLTRFADGTTVVAPASGFNLDITAQLSTNLTTLTMSLLGMRYWQQVNV